MPNCDSSLSSNRPSAASRACSGVLGIAANMPIIGMLHAGVMEKLPLGLENAGVVVVEAQDHAAPYVHARGLDHADPLDSDRPLRTF